MQHAHLSSHQHRALSVPPSLLKHAASREHVHTLRINYAFARQVDRGVGAAALRVDVQRCIRVGGRLVRQVLAVDTGVDVALTGPNADVLTPSLTLDVRA